MVGIATIGAGIDPQPITEQGEFDADIGVGAGYAGDGQTDRLDPPHIVARIGQVKDHLWDVKLAGAGLAQIEQGFSGGVAKTAAPAGSNQNLGVWVNIGRDGSEKSMTKLVVWLVTV